jgi:hypothetical protein
MNYAPVGAMGVAGYMAGQGQYQKWLADYQQKQQEMLMRQQMQQNQLNAQAAMQTSAQNSPLAQAQAGYYNQRGNVYGQQGDTTGNAGANAALDTLTGGGQPTTQTNAARGASAPDQALRQGIITGSITGAPPGSIPPYAPPAGGGLINGMPQNQSGQPLNPAMTPEQLAFFMQKQTQPPVNTGGE